MSVAHVHTLVGCLSPLLRAGLLLLMAVAYMAVSQTAVAQEAVAQEAVAQAAVAAGEAVEGVVFEGLVEISEVLLDVLAVDKSGRVALGLGKDDFTIEENGAAVEITGVSFYATRYGHDGELLTADDVVPSSRYFILFFHDSGQGGSINNYISRQLLEARRGSLTWVEEHLLPSDWVAVASYDVRLKLHQDFTQNRGALAHGIKRAASRKNPEKGLGRRGRPMPPSGDPSLLRHLPTGKALRQQSRTLYDGLRLIAEAAGYQVGRKNLMLFSVGFGEFDLSTLIPEPNPRLYPPMLHALNDHNVATYAIDLTPIEVRHFQGQLLKRLAAETGGRYIRDPMTFITPLQQVSAENLGYYLISYQSEHPADEVGYQEVSVKPRDNSILLRVRQGYRYGSESP